MADLKVSKANIDDITVWKNLQRYPAWKRVVAELEIKIKEQEKIVFTPGYDREKMLTERDVAIMVRQAYLDLIEIPERNINQLSGTGTERISSLDPFREADEISEGFADNDEL